MPRALRGLAVGLVVAAGALHSAWAGDAAPPRPVADLRDRLPEDLGPGRDEPTPPGLREVLVAWFGPDDADHPDWGAAWRGARLAAEQVNAAGGCAGLPLRLAPAWSDSPWGSGTADLARLVHAQGAWAVVGGMNGATTHLAEQIAVKARLAVVSPGGTDPSVNFTNVPWMFTLPATEDRIAPVLAAAVRDARHGGPWALVTGSDTDARAAQRALRSALSDLGEPAPVLHLAAGPEPAHLARAAAEAVAASPRAVVLLAGARASGRLAAALRGAGYAGPLLSGAPAGLRPFAVAAGAAAEGVRFPLLFDPSAPAAASFVAAYEARWGSEPDALAAHSYDAVRLVADAVARAGANRPRIRDALAAAAPWDGATGRLAWDATGRAERRVTMGVWRGGRAAREGSAKAR